jgi:hypothetical protein
MKKVLISAFLCFGMLSSVNADSATRNALNDELTYSNRDTISGIKDKVESEENLTSSERAELLDKAERRRVAIKRQRDVDLRHFTERMEGAADDAVTGTGEYWRALLDEGGFAANRERPGDANFNEELQIIRQIAKKKGIKFETDNTEAYKNKNEYNYNDRNN